MATTTSFAQLRAAPVQDGLRFSAADLEKMPLMGVGCQLQFRQVWVDIHEGALAQHPISQNEFLVLLATEASQQPSDTSEAVNMLLQQLVVVRVEDWEVTHVYARFAKEGAKFHIGIAYATQSPTTINPDLLAQTENFFIGHLSSQKEVDALCHLQVAFQGCENAIRFNRTPGLMQVLTQSHRYVVPMQAQLFDGRKLMVS